MRKSYFAAVAVVAWMGTIFLTEGCKQDEGTPSTNEPAQAANGSIVRAMMGLPFDPSDRASDAKSAVHERFVAALLAEIEVQFPGRLAAIEHDLSSGEADRMQQAKVSLDATIATVARSPEMYTRLQADPVVTGASVQGAPGNAVQALGDPLTGDGGPLVEDSGPLVRYRCPLSADPQPLLCGTPQSADGQPLRLGRVDGRYGDDRNGVLGAAADGLDAPDPRRIAERGVTLGRINSGELTPDPESRLGAYAATRGHAVGTVGNAVHNAIGGIYLTFGNYGQEKIGRVFNSAEARALYDQPVDSCAGFQMAMLEYQYWTDVREEDGMSAGGHMGSMFNPTARDFLQRCGFNF